jgi:hypothetical protein
MLTITATATMATKAITSSETRFFWTGLAGGGGAGVKITAGVPHLWQNRVFSSV